MTKEKIAGYIRGLGVDDVGFAKVDDYRSPKSLAVETFLPGAKNHHLAGIPGTRHLRKPQRHHRHERAARHELLPAVLQLPDRPLLKSEFGARAVTMPYSTPMEQSGDRLALGDFSQRHAAVARGGRLRPA
jgi:hypothetical protein